MAGEQRERVGRLAPLFARHVLAMRRDPRRLGGLVVLLYHAHDVLRAPRLEHVLDPTRRARPRLDDLEILLVPEHRRPGKLRAGERFRRARHPPFRQPRIKRDLFSIDTANAIGPERLHGFDSIRSAP